MEIDLFCIESEDVLIPRIQENCARYRQHVKQVEPHDGAAVLIGGGPSVRDRISAIAWRQKQGQKVFALNGVGAYLNTRGIAPDYQVLLDPQEFMTRYFAPAGEYLIASQCHPKVFEVSPKEPHLWHIAMEGREENTPQHPDGDCLVGGGFTIGLTAMCLVYAMGYRKIHLYGYDSSVTELGDHAYPCPIKEDQIFDRATDVVCTVGGKRFRTNLSLAKQAQTFPKVCDDLISAGCLVTLDCDGLLQAVVAQNNIQNAAQAA